jgi:hypothetical protein
MRIAIALAALLAAAACGHAPAPAPMPVPEGTVSAAPLPPPPTEPRDAEILRLCVVRGGELALIDADYNTATGDTTIGGRPLAEALPVTGAFAENAGAYATGEPIRFLDQLRIVYGLPRALGPSDVVRVGEYGGVPVFAEPGAREPYEVVYLPGSPRCVFQPYQLGGIK